MGGRNSESTPAQSLFRCKQYDVHKSNKLLFLKIHNNQNTKTMRVKQSVRVFLYVLVLSIMYYSCSKKDAIQNKNVELTSMVNSIKYWYDSATHSREDIGEKLSIQSVHNSVDRLVLDNISWDKAILHFDSSNRKGIKIPVSKNELTGERIELASLYHQGKVKGYFVQLKPTKEWYTLNKIRNNYRYVDGEMCIYNIQGVFLKRVFLKLGKLVEKNPINQENLSVNSEGGGEMNGGTYDEVVVTSSNSHSEPGYYYFYFWGNVGGVNNSSEDDSVPYDNSGGGSGGDSGEPTENEEDSIYNNLDSTIYPCAHKIINETLNCNDEVNAILRNVFGVNDNVNLKFIADPNVPDGESGITKHTKGGGNFDFTIGLNVNMLNTSTKDYIAATVIHEGVHAYINYRYGQWQISSDSNSFKTQFPIYWQYRGNDPQHNQMAESYVNLMQNLIINLNPSINSTVARALAWGGLQETTAWRNLSDTNEIKNINIAGRNGDISVYQMKKCQ